MQPQQYTEIHKFLAEKNKDFAREVVGPDSIRYLREFFYHLAFSAEEVKVRESLAQQIEQLTQMQRQEERNPLQSLESFLQFYEEFRQDEELKEALGKQNASFALSFMYKKFIGIYRQLPKEIRGSWLKEFFSLVTQQPRDDFVLIFEQGMRHIIQQVSREDAIKLYNELIQDTDLKELLGERLESVRSHIEIDLLD